ncbi:hypothetical protein [Coxiella-like endosymbiont]|uniref:hypothetical protein n=1 Tax=Coxiella-like endosymbiont TaxID=1592897 RepID=UPI004038F262
MDLNSYHLSRRLGFYLKAKGLKLAASESCTGGDFVGSLRAFQVVQPGLIVDLLRIEINLK